MASQAEIHSPSAEARPNGPLMLPLVSFFTLDLRLSGPLLRPDAARKRPDREFVKHERLFMQRRFTFPGRAAIPSSTIITGVAS